jgi:hypothetical protein
MDANCAESFNPSAENQVHRLMSSHFSLFLFAPIRVIRGRCIVGSGFEAMPRLSKAGVAFREMTS